jgi:hypothetical protein
LHAGFPLIFNACVSEITFHVVTPAQFSSSYFLSSIGLRGTMCRGLIFHEPVLKSLFPLPFSWHLVRSGFSVRRCSTIYILS